MGLLIYPLFRTPVPTRSVDTTGEFLAREFEELDKVAEKHGLKGIRAFADQREIPADFDGPPWELEEVMGPCNDWYAASEGARALAALAQLLRENPRAARKLEWPEALVNELDGLAAILSDAAKAGGEFRLEMS